MRISYEGEGPRIGAKTLYLDYHEIEKRDVINRALMKRVDFVYVNANSCNAVAFKKIRMATQEFPLTLEVPLDRCDVSISDYPEHLFFLNIERDPEPEEKYRILKNVFLKLEARETRNFDDDLIRANKWAGEGYRVLVMPKFLYDDIIQLGKEMMMRIDFVHPKVRVMPPVHHLLEIP